MLRRNFIQAIASIPIVGALFAKPQPKEITDNEYVHVSTEHFVEDGMVKVRPTTWKMWVEYDSGKWRELRSGSCKDENSYLGLVLHSQHQS